MTTAPGSKRQAQPILPGRLGDPNMLLDSDPRTDPRLLAVLKQLDYGGAPPDMGLTASTPLPVKLEAMAKMEAEFDAMLAMLFKGVSKVAGVTHRTEIVKGVDGNDIPLYITSPTNVSGPVRGILHLHGGGMVVQSAKDQDYVHWRSVLASMGMVVIGVEFRNAAGALGVHPFPAGLNDCMSGLDWMFANKAKLGVDKIIVSGESGGGNLSLALSIKAKKEGKLDLIDGTFAMCPYISGVYANPIAELESLFECNNYFFNTTMLGAMASVYVPDDPNTHNPEAWPYWAEVDDLKGIAPTVISVSELDPLRSEGRAYYEKLLAAGVDGFSRTVNGISHAADDMFIQAIPDVYFGTARAIQGFCTSL